MESTTSKRHVGPDTLLALLLRLTSNDLFKGGPIKAYFRPQSSEVRLVVDHGENATGKSLILKNLSKFVGNFDQSGVETFSVSMRMRTSEGMGRGIMFMSERNRSTGVSSVRAVQGSFDNASNRPHPVWIVLDEPDVGLSDRYAAALGAYIADRANKLSPNIRGILLVSHSRSLLRRLQKDLYFTPHEISMGEDQTLAEYLSRPVEEEATIDDLHELRTRGQEIFRYVADFEEKAKITT